MDVPKNPLLRRIYIAVAAAAIWGFLWFLILAIFSPYQPDPVSGKVFAVLGRHGPFYVDRLNALGLWTLFPFVVVYAVWTVAIRLNAAESPAQAPAQGSVEPKT